MSASIDPQEEYINDLLASGQIDNDEASFLRNWTKRM
jgi:hypothetical protein